MLSNTNINNCYTNNKLSSHSLNSKEELEANKPIVITTALPYANGEIHLGHISSTYLPADIFTRFLRISQKKVFHVGASDDFGTPILIKAEKENKTPQEFVDYWNKRDLEDFNAIGISFDKFYKTSSIENQKFVQCIFNKLRSNGHIYEKEVIQFYCDFDNKFLPDRYVIGICPYCRSNDQYSDLCEKCGRVPEEILEPKCGICGQSPIKKTSKHYFFKLSNFSFELKEWLTRNKNLQEDIKNYVLHWIGEGLEDWDITRDLDWGIRIPLEDAKGKVFYGWFDNHLCYISTFNALIKERIGRHGKDIWNTSSIYHFIGKDIIYHHFLFLPAIRMGINGEYKLPDYIPVRGHLMLHNKKISKSRNWYIGLKEFISLFKPDFLRFYIALISTSSQDDINFDWDIFYSTINNELIDNIGNFINRTLSFIKKNYDGIVPEPGVYYEEDKNGIKAIVNIAKDTGEFLHKTETDKALKTILKFSNFFNQYFQRKEPWCNKNSTAPTTLYISINAVRALAILLSPFIPKSAEIIWSQLNNNDKLHEESWEGLSLLKIPPGHRIGNISPVFKKIERKEIEKEKIKLGSID
ncbi:MAG TPA: methionine--tRNA ligase [Nitrososphaeraceae archaeon]